jgi:hypothetical protein
MQPSIAVVGNCQAVGVGNSLQRLLPNTKVQAIFLSRLRSGKEACEAAADDLRATDLVFLQFMDDERFPFLRRSELEQHVGQIIEFPRIAFRGFHPDMLIGTGGGFLPSTNSALAMACFLCGLSEDRTADLFNAYIYKRLGYFEAYAKSVAYLASQDKKYGFSLVEQIPEWQRDGAFMHTYNHPSIRVMWSIAQILCKKAGLKTASASEPPQDNLVSGGVWPVYPEIASRIGIASEFSWRTAKDGTLNLKAFVSRCFAAYRKLGAARVQAPKLDEVVQCIRRELSLAAG